jgi:hypothetical protein
MLLASSAMYRVDNSRSFATLVASFPVSFCTFYELSSTPGMEKSGSGYLDMGFDFRSYFLQMLDDGTFDCTTKICMLICNNASLVSNSIVNVLYPFVSVGAEEERMTWYLQSSFAEKLISRSERNLDNGT